MCRNIKTLFNFDPPATNDEIEAAANQFVRKVSGFTEPSKINQHAYDEAIKQISATTRALLDHLKTHAHPHNREEEAAKAHARALKRFGKQ